MLTLFLHLGLRLSLKPDPRVLYRTQHVSSADFVLVVFILCSILSSSFDVLDLTLLLTVTCIGSTDGDLSNEQLTELVCIIQV